MNRKIIFRVDGNNKIGLGHITRCIALAEMINAEYNCSFAIMQPEQSLANQVTIAGCDVFPLENSSLTAFLDCLKGNEIVVLDGYKFDEVYQDRIKEKGCKLVCIDDLSQQHFKADVIINHALTASAEQYSKEEYTKVLVGNKYVLLRKEFLGIPQNQKHQKHQKFDIPFVCLGGADKDNLSFKVASLLGQLEGIKHVNVLVGSAYLGNIQELKAIDSRINVFQNLPAEEVVKVMRQSTFAIVSASGIAYECAAVGLPMITGHYIDNQLLFYAALILQPNIVGLGSYFDLSLDKLKYVALQLKLAYQGDVDGLIDGKQKQRYLEVFNELCID